MAAIEAELAAAGLAGTVSVSPDKRKTLKQRQKEERRRKKLEAEEAAGLKRVKIELPRELYLETYRYLMAPRLVVLGPPTRWTTPAPSAPLPMRALPLPAKAGQALAAWQKASPSPALYGTLVRRMARIVKLSSLGSGSSKGLADIGGVGASAFDGPPVLGLAARLIADAERRKAAAADEARAAREAEARRRGIPVDDVEGAPEVVQPPPPLYSIVPFGPWLQFNMGPREWRYRARFGEEMAADTADREFQEAESARKRRETAVAAAKEAILVAKLKMEPRDPPVMVWRRGNVVRLESVVRGTQDAADDTRRLVNAYRAAVAHKAAVRAADRAEKRHVRESKQLQIANLRAAGLKHFREYQTDRVDGMAMYTAIKARERKPRRRRRGSQQSQQSQQRDVDALAIPLEGVRPDALRAVLADVGGVDVVFEHWNDWADDSDVEGDIQTRITVDPAGPVPKDAKGRPLQLTPEQVAEREARDKAYDDQIEARRVERLALLARRRGLRMVKAALLRLTALEEDEAAELARREFKQQRKLVRERMLAKKRAMGQTSVAEDEAERAKRGKGGPKLDEHSISLQSRTEKLAGKAAKAELAVMVAREAVMLAAKMRRRADHNARSVKQRTQLKAAEAQRLRYQSNRRNEELLEARQVLAQRAQHVARLAHKEEKLAEIARQVVGDCEWMDTFVLHHRWQRFKTRELHAKLHLYYFTSISQDIITRAEAVAAERHVRSLCEQLGANKVLSDVKLQRLARLKNKFLRNERMRLRRSVLCQDFFPKARLKVLAAGWRALKDFTHWRKGIEKNFQVQFMVRRNQLDIQRTEKERRQVVEHKLHNLTSVEDPELRRKSVQVITDIHTHTYTSVEVVLFGCR